MQPKTLSKCALACSSLLFVTTQAYAQTQMQRNNPLDQLKPSEGNVAQTAQPKDASSSGKAASNNRFNVSVITLKQVIPNSAGTAIERYSIIDDEQLNKMVSGFLVETSNNPSYLQVSALSAQLSQVLRDRGEMLTTVYVPAQKLENGRLELHVMRGTLGKTQITGASTKSNDVIADLFSTAEGDVVTRDNVESQLLRVQNLLPGVSALGSFRQGDKLGQSDAIIDIQEFDVFSGSVYLDNYGNETTGEWRLGTRLEINNPFGWEDRLRVDILANETPDGFDDPNNPIEKDDYQCCFGGFSYEMFSSDLQYSFGIEWSRTQYDIGNNADIQLARLGFSGEANRTRIFANYFSHLTSTFSDTWTLGMSVNRADLYARNEALGQDILLNRDRVPEWDLSYTFTLRDDIDVYYGQVAFIYERPEGFPFPIPSKWVGYSNERQRNAIGQLVTPSRLGADDTNSVRLSGDLNTLISSVSDFVRFKGRFAFQYSNDILAPVQQFSLAGPFGVRAYPSGSFLADSGALASVDVQFPVNQDLELSVFYDIGYGSVNDLDRTAAFDATIQGAGVGVNYRYSDKLILQLSAAHGLGISDGVNGQPGPNLRNGGEEVTGRDENQVFASLIFNF